jgi:DNA invertase Pin-like site-specific DNA recombinase
MNTDQEPDIVEIILRACQAGGLDADTAHLIESQIRTEYGGQRVRIPKKKKHLSPAVRELAIADGLTDMSTEEITTKHRISRATLYRFMKQAGK